MSMCSCPFLCHLTFNITRLLLVWRGRWCQSKPHVIFRVQVSLKEILSVFIRDKCKMSSTLLAPMLSTVKRELQANKLKARASKGSLVPWTGSCNLFLIFSRRLTVECQQNQHVQNCRAHLFCSHLKKQKLVSLILFLTSRRVHSKANVVLHSPQWLSAFEWAWQEHLCHIVPGFCLLIQHSVTQRPMIAFPLHTLTETKEKEFQPDGSGAWG